MKKQKLIVLFLFLLIVSGTLFFLTNYVYGLSACSCSPDFQPTDGFCWPGDYYYNWYQVDSFCLYGDCNFQIDVICETTGGYPGLPVYRIRSLTLALMSPGCCDYENPLNN